MLDVESISDDLGGGSSTTRAKEGYSAKDISPDTIGIGLLLAEGGIPRRIKTAFLTDLHVTKLVRRAVHLRRAA